MISEDQNKEATILLNVITKPDILFNEMFHINGNEISGLNYKNNMVSDIEKNIEADLKIEIYNYKNERLAENSQVGTGSKIIFKNEDGNTIVQYNLILYGDVNGDGKINTVDLLVLQRHILRIQTFSGVFLKAGNLSKNGKNPSSVDSLKIQRHILKSLEIEQ